jgi:hypothetical protein
MLDQHEQLRPLAYHLARKVSYQPDGQEQISTQMQEAGGSLQITGSQTTSLDVVYDF